MILIVNICKDPLHYFEFVRPIEEILKNEGKRYKVKHYKEISHIDLVDVNKIIICGTSLADNTFIDDINSFKFLLAFNKPVLGICGGAHIIGLLLGHKLKENEQIGMSKINLVNSFLDVQGEIEVYHLHQFQVLPETFHEKNFYATLFHPEVRNKEMIVNFAKM